MNINGSSPYLMNKLNSQRTGMKIDYTNPDGSKGTTDNISDLDNLQNKSTFAQIVKGTYSANGYNNTGLGIASRFIDHMERHSTGTRDGLLSKQDLMIAQSSIVQVLPSDTSINATNEINTIYKNMFNSLIGENGAFDSIDTNKDGYLQSSEVAKVLESF